jgi:hypothetical protein
MLGEIVSVVSHSTDDVVRPHAIDGLAGQS